MLELKVDLMVPRHLSATTLGILTGAMLQIIVLLDISPEIVALHLGGIYLMVSAVGTLGKVPAVEFLARGGHINQVGRRQGIAVNVSREDIAVTAESIFGEETILVAIVNQREVRGVVLSLVECVAGREQQAVRSHVGGVTQLVIINGINRVAVVVIGRCHLVADTIGIGLGP